MRTSGLDSTSTNEVTALYGTLQDFLQGQDLFDQPIYIHNGRNPSRVEQLVSDLLQRNPVTLLRNSSTPP